MKAKNDEVYNTFIDSLKESEYLVEDLARGPKKYMGMCKYQDNPVRRIDIRFIPFTSVGAAKLYFTGSGEFNKNMRTFAIKSG